MSEVDDSNVQRVLGRLESKVDLMLLQQTTSTGRVDALELRVGKLERWRSMLAGIWVVTAMVVTYFVQRLGDFLFQRNP